MQVYPDHYDYYLRPIGFSVKNKNTIFVYFNKQEKDHHEKIHNEIKMKADAFDQLYR